MTDQGFQNQQVCQVVSSQQTCLIPESKQVIGSPVSGVHPNEEIKHAIDEQSTAVINLSEKIQVQISQQINIDFPEQLKPSSEKQYRNNSQTKKVDELNQSQSYLSGVQEFLSSDDDSLSSNESDSKLSSNGSEDEISSSRQVQIQTEISKQLQLCSTYLECLISPPFKGQPLEIIMNRHRIRDQSYVSPKQRQFLLNKSGVNQKKDKLNRHIIYWDVKGRLVSRNIPPEPGSRYARMLQRDKNPGYPDVRERQADLYIQKGNKQLPDQTADYFKLSNIDRSSPSPKLHLNRVVAIKQFDILEEPSQVRDEPVRFELIQLPKLVPSHCFVVVETEKLRLENMLDLIEATPPVIKQQPKKQKQKSEDLQSCDFAIISQEEEDASGSTINDN